MSGTQKLIGWALFAVVIAALVFASAPDRARPEGYAGSYLGRAVPGQQAATAQDKELTARLGVMRF